MKRKPRQVADRQKEHVADRLASYALGCLEAEEERRVLEHLASCGACRAALEVDRATVDLLALAAPCTEPPALLERKVLAAARRARRAKAR